MQICELNVQIVHTSKLELLTIAFDVIFNLFLTSCLFLWSTNFSLHSFTKICFHKPIVSFIAKVRFFKHLIYII